MSNQAVDVEILGKLTRVNCPSGQEDALVQAAQDLDNRLKEMAERTKVTNEVKLLTIAALNICYELQTQQHSADDQNKLLAERMEKLTASLEGALKNVPQGQLTR
ncbi:Z-ring-associated protein [Vibrio sp. 10N.286.49.B3]|uniref:cell division protein ZapA n=1 Tax=Vibrio sp. 10N.286.49.B3 TaxID=1880855 RepID=UPI000C81D828|nr:cell division protein ZapA [Vibrio sp. 10N.286.49.B3]PMH43869.1 Z-ring-associated protein [Vibrio sp. 10N.286.49.B3]